MRCTNCKRELRTGSAFCPHCGKSVAAMMSPRPPRPSYTYPYPKQRSHSGIKVIAGMVMLAVVAFLAFQLYLINSDISGTWICRNVESESSDDRGFESMEIVLSDGEMIVYMDGEERQVSHYRYKNGYLYSDDGNDGERKAKVSWQLLDLALTHKSSGSEFVFVLKREYTASMIAKNLILILAILIFAILAFLMWKMKRDFTPRMPRHAMRGTNVFSGAGRHGKPVSKGSRLVSKTVRTVPPSKGTSVGSAPAGRMGSETMKKSPTLKTSMHTSRTGDACPAEKKSASSPKTKGESSAWFHSGNDL